MKTLKGWISLTLVLGMLLLPGTANAGIIVTGLEACTEPANEKAYGKIEKLGGIIVTGLTGIIVTGFTGIIVTGLLEKDTNENENCGIIVTG